jgi:hypothetical protein
MWFEMPATHNSALQLTNSRAYVLALQFSICLAEQSDEYFPFKKPISEGEKQ